MRPCPGRFITSTIRNSCLIIRSSTTGLLKVGACSCSEGVTDAQSQWSGGRWLP
jgi:hypothetical protein